MSLLEAARAWAEHDPDPATRAALRALVAGGELESIRRAFEAPLVFGTAGLRGPVGPGPARMNLAVVLGVSHALSLFLKETGLATRPILIGFDGRAESVGFARAAAEVHRAHGFRVLLFTRPGPTPWVAFGARFLGAAAGIALTPSHNPRGDAGYKLYDDQGVQIVSPWDTRVAELLLGAPPADQIPRRGDGIEAAPSALLAAYDAWLSSLGARVRGATGEGAPPVIRIGYTPLHGVGLEPAARAARAQGIELVAVPEQAAIDGGFPTVPFPNPEEPGALDALLDLLERERLDLGYANDPDADRLALVAPRAGELERVRTLSGDQLGLLLADIWFEAWSSSASAGVVEAGSKSQEEPPLIVSTVVSSPALDAWGRARGARVERTLTGFKWLCRPALAASRFVFAYEEALGYCFGFGEDKPLLDKDGVAALTVLSAFVRRELEREPALTPGAVIARRLAGLARELGLWVSRGKSLRLEGGVAAATALVARLRRAPVESLGGRRIERVVDYLEGAAARPFYLGAQDLLVFELEGGARLCVRPSGTEPKLKLYAHAVAPLALEEDYARVERALEAEVDALLEEVGRGLLGG